MYHNRHSLISFFMNCGKVWVIFGGVTIETGLNFELFMNEFVCKEKKESDGKIPIRFRSKSKLGKRLKKVINQSEMSKFSKS